MKTILSLIGILLFSTAAIAQDGEHRKVAICHKGKTIYISEPAVQAHLNHGDVIGSCDGSDRWERSDRKERDERDERVERRREREERMERVPERRRPVGHDDDDDRDDDDRDDDDDREGGVKDRKERGNGEVRIPEQERTTRRERTGTNEYPTNTGEREAPESKEKEEEEKKISRRPGASRR